jgi:hypothetical protein
MARSFCLIAIVVLYAATLARADESQQPPSVESVRIGFDNTYKLGCWAPVDVVLSKPLGQGRGVELQAPDGDSVPARFLDASAKSVGSRLFTYAKIGRGAGPIEVLLRQGRGGAEPSNRQTLRTFSAGELPRALPATNELVVELGASIGLAELARRARHDESDPSRMVVVTLDKPQRLPDRWYGYEGVDLVVVPGTPEVKQFFADPRSITALEHWVRLGGVLLIACGNDADSLLANGKLLSRFAPGEFAEMATLPPRGIAAIETFAGSEGTQERLNAAGLRVPLWRDVQGQALLGLGDRATDFPLIVHRPLGFGQVIFVGLDLHKPPFTEWPSHPHFLERLLDRPAQRSGEPSKQLDSSRSRQLGFVDLSGQLRGALDQFDDVGLIPFWAIAFLVLAYVGILFPLNYWVATRWFKRPQLAWVSFVLTAAVFSAGAYSWADHAKGNRLRVNQIDLIDVNVADGTARGTTWFNVFTPSNAKFDLQVRPNFAGLNNRSKPFSPGSQTGAIEPLDAQTPSYPDTYSLISWLGLPGTGLGGMNSPAAGAPLYDEPYEIGAGQGGVVGAPIGIWSSKAFVSRWQASGAGIEADLTVVSSARLQGTIKNSLSIPLEECVIMFGNRAWIIGTLAPGKKLSVDSLDATASQTVESYLTKRRWYSNKEQVPPYDRAGFDVTRILEMMMFHQQAGGENYTGLLHRYQRYVDLSTQLDLGRAILIGRAATGAVVEIDGTPVSTEAMKQHTTVYRYVIPVKLRQ